jgi:hypothetical protein
MSARSEWSISSPQKLAFDDPVTALRVRIVGGTVNVVGTDSGPARLELSQLDGPPLTVSHRRGALSVGYDDLPGKGLRKWLDRTSWDRAVHVTLTVPTGTDASVGVVGATAVVSGLTGRTDLHSVSGDLTLVGLTGEIRVHTVSGRMEAQAVTGDLRFDSVSGDLTVIDSSGSAINADSVSGAMVLDLAATGKGAGIALTTVSGEIAIRLPHPADIEVTANTASGTFSNAFDDLQVAQWGSKLVGRLGTGHGKLRATTVSGAIALLRRPVPEDTAYAEQPAHVSGAGPGSGSGTGPHRAGGPEGPDGPQGKAL